MKILMIQNPKTVATFVVSLALAGCATAPLLDEDGAFIELPEAIVSLAAPYQNLNKVRLGPDDNCYWYLHNGPVEATWLPLRTEKGNRLCQAES